MVDVTHMLHKKRPFIRSKEEAEAYLKACFPKCHPIIRVGQGKPNTNEAPFFVGVGGAFGAGSSWDHAVAHLMSDDMIGVYVEK